MKLITRLLIAALLVQLGACLAARAQRPSEVVKWTVQVTRATAKSASATVSASIQDSWHVYALSQPAGGPTPMRISIPAGSSFTLASPVPETKVIRHFDANFNMGTVFYLKAASFNLALKGTGSTTEDTVPIDVRFQACNDRLCLPPYTTHLSADLKRR